MGFYNSMYRKEMMDNVTSRYFTSLESLEPSPFTAYSPKRDLFCSADSCESPRSPGTFLEIEQMWEDKWHGVAPVEGAVESMLQEKPSVMATLVSALSFKRKSSPTAESSRPSDGSSEGGNSPGAPSGVLGSLRRLISNRQREGVLEEEGCKPTGSGPCEAFADWPIPRYPDDHEWDD
ncbi:hypothetical protein BSKO_11302 [Bryopsis sp. KO-2023]|nr:hypothetical protein BSKO_11302 [Bryopsis sp. KO-2023]